MSARRIGTRHADGVDNEDTHILQRQPNIHSRRTANGEHPWHSTAESCWHNTLDDRLPPNPELTSQHAEKISSTFSALLEGYIRKMPADAKISHRQLEEILGGAAEVVLEHEASPSSAPVAMMHCGDRGTPSKTHREPKWPNVNLQTNERSFAILDEGCNSTCPTSAWAEKAPRAFALCPKTVGPLQGQPRSYRGIGAAKSSGKTEIPVVGSIVSDELDKQEHHYMLLCLWTHKVHWAW